MHATLTFNLPEDEEELRMAQTGHKYLNVLRTVASDYKAQLKHGTLSDAEYKYVTDMSDKLYRELESEGVNLYD